MCLYLYSLGSVVGGEMSGELYQTDFKIGADARAHERDNVSRAQLFANKVDRLRDTLRDPDYVPVDANAFSLVDRFLPVGTVKSHGFYSGPGWSAGKAQTSVVSKVNPVDIEDRIAMYHDAAYAIFSGGTDADAQALSLLDLESSHAFRNDSGGSLLDFSRRTASSIALYNRAKDRKNGGFGESLFHASEFSLVTEEFIDSRIQLYIDSHSEDFYQIADPVASLEICGTCEEHVDPIFKRVFEENLGEKESEMTKKSKTAKEIKELMKTIRMNAALNKKQVAKPKKKKSNKVHVGLAPSAKASQAPVSIGTTLRSSPNVVKSASDNSVTVLARDLLTSVISTNLVNVDMSLWLPMNPVYLSSSSLSMYFTDYDSYKINQITFYYVPACASTTVGEVLMYVVDNPLSSLLNPNDSALLTKIMSEPIAAMGPCWQQNSIVWRPSSVGYKKLNPLIDLSPIETCFGDFCVYTTNESATTLGYVVADWDITFKDKRFNAMANKLYANLKPPSLVSCADYVTHVVNNPVTLYINSIPASGIWTEGTVVEFVFDSETAAMPTWSFGNSSYSNAVTTVAGNKFYGTVSGTYFGNVLLYVYANYDEALSQTTTARFLYNDTAAIQTFYIYYAIVYASPAYTYGLA
jgi:hypothetical protein